MPTPSVLETCADPLHALLIEDNASDRDLFAAAVRRCGHEMVVAAAESGDDAIRWLDGAGRVPDLIFLDLHLPGRDAREVVEWIRQRPDLARTLIIAVTGDVSCACAPARDYGASAVLVKPISVDDIMAMTTLARVVRVT